MVYRYQELDGPLARKGEVLFNGGGANGSEGNAGEKANPRLRRGGSGVEAKPGPVVPTCQG